MSTLYIECKMGVAGDMLSASLLELCPDRDKILNELNNMGLTGVNFFLEKSEKCGITGSHFKVLVEGEEEESHDHHHHEDHEHHHDHDHDHEHEDHEHHHDHDHEHEDHEHHHDHNHHHTHRSMHDIEHIVSELKISDAVKNDVINVYKLIAAAESAVHGKDVSEIHFHEVGSMDAIADITAACLIIGELKPDRICASPVHVGSGHVHCAHGILPVPAPATALLLEGIPSYSGDIEGELCTPTGAALLKYFAASFGPQPVMSVSKIGYGMGKKNFPKANCVRAMLGEETVQKDNHLPDTASDHNSDRPMDTVTELRCNIDDMTPEDISFATWQILLEGALDVFTSPINMKKNRAAFMLTVLCKESDTDRIVDCIFKHTTTIGIRENICRRYILNRQEKTASTSFGEVRIKEVSGYGVKREKPEYDDISRLAKENGISIKEVRKGLFYP